MARDALDFQAQQLRMILERLTYVRSLLPDASVDWRGPAQQLFDAGLGSCISTLPAFARWSRCGISNRDGGQSDRFLCRIISPFRAAEVCLATTEEMLVSASQAAASCRHDSRYCGCYSMVDARLTSGNWSRSPSQRRHARRRRPRFRVFRPSTLTQRAEFLSWQVRLAAEGYGLAETIRARALSQVAARRRCPVRFLLPEARCSVWRSPSRPCRSWSASRRQCS